jgi:hypothetical protein
VKWEQGSKYSKTHKGEREKVTLHFNRHLQFGKFEDIHGTATGSEIDTKNTYQQQS